MKNQFDQYGKPIPQDLTLLELGELEKSITKHQVSKILLLDWYAFEGNKTPHIFVSNSKLEQIMDGLLDVFGPEECVTTVFQGQHPLIKIDTILHRWNNENGFYHA